MPPTAPPKKTAPPQPPRALILMDAPTNAWVAAHFAKHGYSVEMVLDLKYCNTPLLKTARHIILGPNTDKSPYYEKIKATLKKMVPDRLYEQEGTELLKAVRERVQDNIQKPKASHPSDKKLAAEAREKQDQAELAKLKKAESVAPPSATDQIQGLISATLLQSCPDEGLQELGGQLSKVTLESPAFKLNEDMDQLLAPYLKVCTALGILDGQRTSIAIMEDCPEDAQEDIKKQQGSLRKPLAPGRMLEKAEQFRQQVKTAKEAGKEFPPRKLPVGDLYDQVIDLGQMADQFLEEKAKLRLSTQEAFAKNICKDRFYKVGSALGLNCDALHGGMYLFLALSAKREALQGELKLAYKKWSSLSQGSGSETKSGGLGLFKKKKIEDEQPEENPELDAAAKTLTDLVAQCLILDYELPTYEKELCASYWSVFEKACKCILDDKVHNKSFLRYLRAFMRFGLISDHPSLISKEQSQIILSACDDVAPEFHHEDQVTNIIYPDEAFDQIRKGIIPPSFDEELELEGQGTPKYKYDKSIRKIYSSNFKIAVYLREKNKWLAKKAEKDEAQKSAETMLAEHEKGTKDYKVIQTAVREARAEIVRVSKVVEKIDTIIENEKETIETQEENLKGYGFTPDFGDIAANETKTMRSMCKLLGNRKENFLPFILRDNFKPELNNLNDRTTMTTTLAEFEANDPTIFTIDLANAQNPRKQVIIRFSPTIMIYPVLGNMGFCVAPSSSSDSGRLILPVMSGSQVPLPRMMVDMFADFRYDTAKENAGVDLMTSDTICAAYAKVRWDYRKKGKEFREKAGIYNDMQDKKNFVVHYRLYIESMDESGKKLFFKCHEMYEGFAKYIPLPAGKTKLSKG